jgi:hypothetical protein
MTPADFHAQARGIQFSGARCADLQHRLAQLFGTQVCTDEIPCGFHRELAAALAAAYRAGRESAGSRTPAG